MKSANKPLLIISALLIHTYPTDFIRYVLHSNLDIKTNIPLVLEDIYLQMPEEIILLLKEWCNLPCKNYSRISQLIKLFVYLQQCDINLAENPKLLLAGLSSILEQENKANSSENNLDFIDKLKQIIDQNDLMLFSFMFKGYLELEIDHRDAILRILQTACTDLHKILIRNIYKVIELLGVYPEIREINIIQSLLNAVNHEINASYYENIQYYDLGCYDPRRSILLRKYYILNANNMEVLKKEDVKSDVLQIEDNLMEIFELLVYYAKIPNRDPNFKLEIKTQHARILIAVMVFVKSLELTEQMRTLLKSIILEDEAGRINILLQRIADINGFKKTFIL